MLVLGAHGQLLEGEGSLGSSFLAARALDAAGPVQGPRALGTRRLLEGEAAEAPPELRCPCRAGAVQREGWCRGAPCGADELGDAGEPLIVEVVNRTVVQKLPRQEQRDMHVRRSATSMGR